MRTSLLASAAVLGLGLALPAFAQTATDPTPANPSAIKDGTPAAGTGSGAAPGNDPAASGKTGATLGSQAPQGGPGPMGEQANPAPSSGSSMGSGASGTESSGAMAAPASPSAATPDNTATSPDSDTTTTKPRYHARSGAEGNGHWAHQPGTGESGPASERASNIDRADTHSVIAPHLPSPGVGANAGPDRYLAVAEHALRAHKTGEAQQALEMAETRLLDRSTAPGNANEPDQNPRIAAVTAARKALAARDWEGARKNIQEAMNRGGGEGGMASGQATGSGGMASGTTNGGSGTMSSGMSSTSAGTGMGSTSTMAPNSTSQGVAGGNAGASPAPMDLSAQGPATPGAAGTPTPGASATVPNQMQPSAGAK